MTNRFRSGLLAAAVTTLAAAGAVPALGASAAEYANLCAVAEGTAPLVPSLGTYAFDPTESGIDIGGSRFAIAGTVDLKSFVEHDTNAAGDDMRYLLFHVEDATVAGYSGPVALTFLAGWSTDGSFASVFCTRATDASSAVSPTSVNYEGSLASPSALTVTLEGGGKVRLVRVARDAGIGAIAESILDAAADGDNPGPRSEVLLNILGQADEMLASGNTTAAKNLLDAFCNMIQAMINSRKIDPALGQSLIDAARALAASL